MLPKMNSKHGNVYSMTEKPKTISNIRTWKQKTNDFNSN